MSNRSHNSSPPKEHQFKKGQSGNPNGRPKKKRGEASSALSALSQQSFEVRVGDEKRNLTAEEFAQQNILTAAFKGNKKALAKVVGWVRKREAMREKLAKPKLQTGAKIQIEAIDKPDVDEALFLLGIISVNTEWSDIVSGFVQQQLEPEAVQAALSRRRGTKRLDPDRLSWLLACTKDGKTVRLPRGYSHDSEG